MVFAPQNESHKKQFGQMLDTIEAAASALGVDITAAKTQAWTSYHSKHPFNLL